MDNLKEFKALIKRYESITIEEIENIKGMNGIFTIISIAKELTGFSSMSSCSLCKGLGRYSAEVYCDKCVWVCKTISTCADDDNKDTYNEIYYSENTEQLLKAFKERAEYMKTVLKIKT